MGFTFAGVIIDSNRLRFRDSYTPRILIAIFTFKIRVHIIPNHFDTITKIIPLFS